MERVRRRPRLHQEADSLPPSPVQVLAAAPAGSAALAAAFAAQTTGSRRAWCARCLPIAGLGLGPRMVGPAWALQAVHIPHGRNAQRMTRNRARSHSNVQTVNFILLLRWLRSAHARLRSFSKFLNAMLHARNAGCDEDNTSAGEILAAAQVEGVAPEHRP